MSAKGIRKNTESNGMYVKGVGLLKVEGLRFSLSKRKLLTVEYFPQ